MANAIYPAAKDSFLKGEIDLIDDTIKIALVDTGTYTYNAAHDFYNDLSGVMNFVSIELLCDFHFTL